MAKPPVGIGMKTRKLVMLAATLALGAVVAAKWSNWAPWDVWTPKEAAAQAGKAEKQAPAPRAVPVDVVAAVKKKMPVRVDLLGTVTPIASVAVKTRVGHPGQGRAGYGLAIHS